MMFKRPLRVFVSYSHEDRDVVVPVVTLLRAMQSHVFLDFQSIEPARVSGPMMSSVRCIGRTSS